MSSHSAIKEELQKTEEKRRMSRWAGVGLTEEQIGFKKDLKGEIKLAMVNKKVSQMSEGVVVDEQLVKKKLAIKAALEQAIKQKMIKKTKDVTGIQTLHKV